MFPHWLIDAAADTVVVCSILHSVLPPWDFLSDFPRAQKFYKAAIYAIGYVALNARSTVYSKTLSQSTEPPQPPPSEPKP